MEKILTKNLLELLVPPELLKSFELDSVNKYKDRYELEFTEKAERIPVELKGKKAVLNGYWNSLELQTFPIKGLPCYIKIKRRKWKEPGGSESYGNNYNFDIEGTKATKEFGAFLKEYLR
jgi:hypothetical protein